MYSVGNFFSTVTKFYNEINPATLSGAIDIIVVQQADGELACSPFHVRFGKLSVLRPQEKVVEVRVNGDVIPFSMKVGDAGEAFFVLETNDYVPDEFATSPIAGPADESDFASVDYFDLNGQPLQRVQHLLEGMNGELRQADEDLPLDNGYVSAASGHGSAFEESLKDDDDSDRESVASVKANSIRGEVLDMPGSFGHRSHIPLSESPLPISGGVDQNSKPSDLSHTTDNIDFPVNSIFPTVMHEGWPNGSHAMPPRNRRRKSEILFDMTGYKTDSEQESSDGEDDLPRGILSDSERNHRSLRRRIGRNGSNLTPEQRQRLLDDIRQGAFLKPEENLANTQMERAASRNNRRKKRAGIPTAWHGKKGRKRANSMPNFGQPDSTFPIVQPSPKRVNDTQPKNSSGAAETLAKREPRPSVMSDTEMEYETSTGQAAAQGKEWTWGWGSLPVKQSNPDEDDEIKESTGQPNTPETPVEIETKDFQMGSTTCRVALSLCGEDDFGKDLAASHKAFKNAQLSFEAFSKDPAAVLADKKLVCYLDGRFYTWSNAVPQLVSLLFFHQPLAEGAAPDLKDHKATGDRPSSTRFGTISRWFRKAPAGSNSLPATPDAAIAAAAPSAESTAMAGGSDDDEIRLVNKALRSKSLPPLDTGRDEELGQTHVSVPALSEKPVDGTVDKKRYAKTLRLTSEQLRSLNLRKGANTVSFSVSSAYQGTATCVAKIFLWDHDSQVVISDIDGTITKSDALGHIFAMAGRDWTHLGVAKLFTDIRSNGYHILYLTSRAIGQADYTRKYLQKVEQNSYQLPDGPVIMSPDRLFSAFHREVIIRKPEVFKMACLRDVKKLFGDRNPFYAGFGNRITDALSYRSVNVPPSRIFTIDSYGEVKLELLSAFKSSYLALNDLVNEIFPGQRVVPEFNDWNYWKDDLPKIELPDLPVVPNKYGTTGSSTSLLSSTTSVAKRVASLTQTSSNGSVRPSSPTSPTMDGKSRQSTLGRYDTWTSDDDSQEQQGQDDTMQRKQGQSLKEVPRKTRAGSPSMLSALVPTRLIRAVRSGSTSSHVAPIISPAAPTPAPQSPEIKGIVGSLPSSPSPPATVRHEVSRPVSISSSPPSESLLTGDDMAMESGKTLAHQSHQDKVSLTDDLVAVKQETEDEDEVASKLLQRSNGVADQLNHDEEEEEDYGGEEEYQGDYEDDNEGEEYGDEDDEDDDDYLDQIEEDLGEPFL